MLSNRWYDVLKWLAQLVLPASATLYFGVSSVWDFPYQTEIVGSIVATNVWLSALLVVSNAQFQAVQIESLKYKATGEDDYIQVPGAPFGMDKFTYNILKWVTLAFFPASGALYFTVAGLWGFPYGAEVAATVAAITVFSGVVLGVSKTKFAKVQQN